MQASLKNKITFVLTSISIVITIFLLIVYFQNHTSMIITMDTKNKSSLNPQFYFSEEGEGLSEHNSRKAHTIKKNKYYFLLQDIDSIKHARLDPSKKKNLISLHDILIIKSSWFTTTTYTLPLKNIKPLQHIKILQQSNKSIDFKTTGNDSQFIIDFTLKELTQTKKLPIKSVISSFLIFMLFLFLYSLYKTKKDDDTFNTKLILYALFLALAIFKVDYYKDHVNRFYPPDELAHLSYIQHIHTHDRFIPKFEQMRMINNKEAGNYLNHPPLYYHLMNFVYNENASIYNTVNSYRELNMLIFIASFMLLLYLSFQVKITVLGHFIYLSVITSIPMYAYEGASITNDNLAILAALIFIIGFKRLIEESYTTGTYFLIGFGIFLAYFSKLTVAILIFFALVFFLLYLLKIKKMFTITKLQILMLTLFILPIVYYQTYILITYHSLMPSFNITYPEQFLKSGFYIPEEYRQNLSPMQWFERMKMYIQGGWFGIHSHHSFTKDSVFEYFGLLLLHIMAIITLFLKCNKDSKSYCIVGKIGMLSLFMVLIVQFIFSYKTHLTYGYLGGLQPRYLLPFMFAFAIMASLFVERFKQYFLFNISIIIICIHAIYSDFFYFLKYYQ